MTALDDVQRLDQILQNRDVFAVFQPIVDVSIGKLLGFEALIRGPEGSPLNAPKALFAAAQQADRLVALELLCQEAILEAFLTLKLEGKLFINMSPYALVATLGKECRFLHTLEASGLDAQRIVIELSEQYPLDDIHELQTVLDVFKRKGFGIAIDDLGAGYAGLKTWSMLAPNYVKIDRHFISNIHQDAIKRDFVRMIREMGGTMQCRIIAEGIETREELVTLQGLGIEFMQGYWLGKPARRPAVRDTDTSASVLAPFQRASQRRKRTIMDMVQHQPAIAPNTRLEWVADIFHAQDHLHSLPICEDGKPLGIVSRSDILDAFAIRFGRDLNARKPVGSFLHAQSIIVDAQASMDQVSRMITDNHHYDLNMDFIITQDDRYLGVGKPKTLLRSITEQQIRFAQYANPLTQLPGNVPIYEAVDALLASDIPFVMAYYDLNSFKPYNDFYGYSRGDEVIKCLADIIQTYADSLDDFVGHIGGDDFVVIFRSQDWRLRCERMLQAFAQQVRQHYDRADWQRGGILSQDRRGNQQFFEPLSLAIGVVSPDPALCRSHHAIAALAADAKHHAKRLGGNQIFISRRKIANRLLLDSGQTLQNVRYEQR